MRRLIVVAAVVGMVAAVVAIARQAAEPTMDLLYSGLDPAVAGDVVSSLEQSGIAYEVRGSSIFVDARQRDAVRMALAAEGKPSMGSAGYEILDGLSGFGTTAQMFDVAHRRAIEGELARTILAIPAVTAARVHIAGGETRPFSRNATSSASVAITTDGTALSAGAARAIRVLVASAVDGLSADRVAVVDSERGLLTEQGEGQMAGAQGEDHAAALKANVERILFARVGDGRAIVEVRVETVSQHEAIVERIIDPDSRVAISTITEENTTSAQDSRSGAVTVASNVPDGAAGGSGGNSSSQDNRAREQVNYEVSETQREVTRLPGAIRRITVAVLVDGVRSAGTDGAETWAPRGPEELAALEALVASAVGFDEGRGDEITIESLQFPEPAAADAPEPPVPGVIERLGLDLTQIAQIAILGAVALILGLFVVRPLLSGGAGNAPSPLVERIDPPRERDAPPQGLPEPEPASSAPILEPLPSLPPVSTDPAERLRELSGEKRDATTTVLREWMETREPAA